MASNLLGVCILLFSVVLVGISADGVCNKTELTGDKKLVRKWKYVSGRRKTYMDFEPIKRTVLACCDGYLIDTSPTTVRPPGKVTPVCNPQCEPPCFHGTCVKPNVCTCFPGYQISNGTCQPVCSEPCNNGTCVEPETCKCLSGYRMTDVNVCTPACSMGCGNGTCISPEVCQCNDGYTLTNGICEPKCWPPCETGKCIAPDTCSCDPGYERITSNVTVTCEPICSPACENGVCVGPNICMCDRGYAWHNGTCRPICSETCINATCVAPETCKCFEGYTEYSKQACNPKCNGCEFGVCVRPEVCECTEGFFFINGTCKPVCDPPCVNGVCTVLFDCQCNAGYNLKNGICESELKIYDKSTTKRPVTHDDPVVGTDWLDATRYDVVTFEPESYSTVKSLPVKDASKSHDFWMYYMIPVVVLLLIVFILILIWKRHLIGDFFVGRSYTVSEDATQIANKSNIPDVTFSALQEREAKKEGKS